MQIAMLASGSQERLWLKTLLAQTTYRRESFELAVPEFPGQPARWEGTLDLLIASEGAVPPHLFAQLLNELPARSAVLLFTSDPATYRGMLTQGRRRGWAILHPSSQPPQIQTAIAAVLQGLCVFQPTAEADRLFEPLTPREHEIAVLVAQGLTNKQIALRLHLSGNTVKTHITAIYGKSGVNNRTELATLAVRLGWIAL